MYKGYKLPEISDCEIIIEEYTPPVVQNILQRSVSRVEEIKQVANVSETSFAN
jgi:hypothetical protein